MASKTDFTVCVWLDLGKNIHQLVFTPSLEALPYVALCLVFCLGSGFILLFLFCFACYIRVDFLTVGVLDSWMISADLWKYYLIQACIITLGDQSYLSGLENLYCSILIWSVTGLLYVLPLLCLSTKYEVSGLWEEEEWCNQEWEGWSDRRGRPWTM